MRHDVAHDVLRWRCIRARVHCRYSMKTLLPRLGALLWLLIFPVAGYAVENSAGGGQRRVAFVFDDGPVVGQSGKMLAVLAKENIHVTFSYIGQNVVAHPELAKAAFQAGHEINNHSYTHPHLKTLDDATVLQEVTKTSAAIKQATGHAPAWFWAPFLETDQRIDALIRQAGLEDFPLGKFNFVSTDDWNPKETDAAKILKRATTGIRDRTVILCHEWRKETLEDLPAIISELRRQGFVFLTFSEMARTKN